MDRVGADFNRVKEMMIDRLGANAVALQLPVGSEDQFVGVVDLVSMKTYYYDSDVLGANYRVEDGFPEEMREEVEIARETLMEVVSDLDEDVMEAYLEGKEIPLDKVKALLRDATIKSKIYPVFCGTAFKNKGVQPLLDGVVDYLPSPLDLPPVKGIQPKKEKEVELKATDEKLGALIFKIMSDPYVGELCFVRVYSGELKVGTAIYNSVANKSERVGRLLSMHANKREDVTSITAGNIGAIVGLKNATTGSTLCDKNFPVVLESMVFPDPVISVAIEPKTVADEERLSYSLAKLAKEDPSFKVNVSEETGQTIISGMGELHLEVLVERLRREFKVAANVGRPQVSYRETISKPVKVNYKHQKQTGGKGQFAHVVMSFEPLEAGSGFVFEEKIKGGAIPSVYFKPIINSLEATSSNGKFGFPVVDFKVTLEDGSFHEVDSSEMAFKVAASMAFREALEKAGSKVLEPLMKVEVTVPEHYMGDVLGDIQGRRGEVAGMEEDGGNRKAKKIYANVPLSEMFGYATDLRSKTQGRGTYTMQFAFYKELPESIRDEYFT